MTVKELIKLIEQFPDAVVKMTLADYDVVQVILCPPEEEGEPDRISLFQNKYY